MTAPRSSSRIRVRYAETDQMGVVYYANYFVWFEVGRTDLLRESGWTYRDMEVGTSGTLVSPIRVQFTYEVVRTADAVTLATGTTVHATLDRSGRPCRLP